MNFGPFESKLISIAKKNIGAPSNYLAPFPQADSVQKILELSCLVANSPTTPSLVTIKFDFSERQAAYYLSALKYLGLAIKDPQSRGGWISTPLSKKIASLPGESQSILLAELILSTDSCAKSFLHCVANRGISYDEAIAIFNGSTDSYDCTGETVRRRAKTVHSWVTWVFETFCTK